ncbi:Pirin [Azospirillaceae bacterium]
MGELHDLIRTHGKDNARAMINPEQVPFFQIASSIICADIAEFGIIHSGFCLAGFPHRQIPNDQPWVRANGAISLLVEPGRRPTTPHPRTSSDYEYVGVPYGSKARLILIYLQTEALRKNSPLVRLGRSMNQWLERMDISTGGTTYKEVRNQAERISRCRLTFEYSGKHNGSKINSYRNETIVKTAINMRKNTDQGHLFDDLVELSDAFFQTLKSHPVPVWEPAIKQIAGKSMALDIYLWLAYRLHIIDKPMIVSWTAVFSQFGPNRKYKDELAYKHNLRSFKAEFCLALNYVLAVYEDAKVQIGDEGVTLFPSRPPVPGAKVPSFPSF